MPELDSIPHWRLFIALTVPENVKAAMAGAQSRLRQTLSRQGQDCARWTRLEQLHLTLNFLGNVDAPRIDDLTAAMRNACRGVASLQLRAVGVGCFPNFRAPRVGWAGVRDLDGKLPELHRSLADAVRTCTQEPKPEAFAGHVTLGRFKDLGRPDAETLARVAKGMAGEFFGEWTADKIELMRSELSSQGARHSCLAAIPLGHVA